MSDSAVGYPDINVMCLRNVFTCTILTSSQDMQGLVECQIMFFFLLYTKGKLTINSSIKSFGGPILCFPALLDAYNYDY